MNMPYMPYETLHNEDFAVVGMAADAVPLIAPNLLAIQKRADALTQERIEASRKAGRI